ncbi:MAG: hypothetical protein WCK98_06500 [bacterium]
MTKYALIFTGGVAGTTPEEIAAKMQIWGVWYGTIGANLVDGGSAFMPHKTASTVTKMGVESGSKTGASGYVIVQSDNKDIVLEYAKSCPIISDGGSVDVHEFMPMN